ncbi:hypothetical protein, partial [Bacillus mycoides]|uniref:hypothetical protein n=1 Tax=Bacillus mycoides TaxID=1405 RepID=UPI002110FFB0
MDERTSGSAGTITSPSRATQYPVFGLFGLAKYLYLPKSTHQWWSVAKKVEIFERFFLKNTTCPLMSG